MDQAFDVHEEASCVIGSLRSSLPPVQAITSAHEDMHIHRQIGHALIQTAQKGPRRATGF